MKLKIGDQVRFTRNMPGWEDLPLRRRGSIAQIYYYEGNDCRIMDLDGKIDPGLWMALTGIPLEDFWELLGSAPSCFCNENKEFSIDCLECMKKYYP